MNSMVLPLKRYAEFGGRSRRKEYWLFQLLWLIGLGLSIALCGAGIAIEEATPYPKSDENPLFILGLLLVILWILGTIIPMIAVTVRRFHDQDYSGWMYLLNFIPWVGGLIVFVFMRLPGTKGPNQFGEDPTDEGFSPQGQPVAPTRA